MQANRDRMLTRQECLNIEEWCIHVGQLLDSSVQGGQSLPDELTQSLRLLREHLDTDPPPPIRAMDIELTLVYPFLERLTTRLIFLREHHDPQIVRDANELYTQLSSLSENLITNCFGSHESFFRHRLHMYTSPSQDRAPLDRQNDRQPQNNPSPKGLGK